MEPSFAIGTPPRKLGDIGNSACYRTPQNDGISCSLPAQRYKSILTEAISSPLSRRVASPAKYGSPSRLESELSRTTWRDLKGHLGKLLGRGGFGCVYKANIHGFELAVKCLRYSSTTKSAILKSLQSEKLAKTLRHKNIVVVHHINDRDETKYVIMEYAGSHNLQQILDEQVLPEEKILLYAQDIASALNFIHSQKIVHLDVKPGNVLVTSFNVAKLGDFGCAQKLDWDDMGDVVSPTNRTDITGTVAYRAPELLKGLVPTSKADIYAYGVLVWQMLSQKHPYSGKNSHMVIFAVVAQGLRPSVTELCCREELITLCKWCWSAEPDDRPNANNILQMLHDMPNS